MSPAVPSCICVVPTREGLAKVLHRIAVELLRDNPWSHGPEGVVALADEPVGARGKAPRRPAAAIRDVEHHHVAEDVIGRLARRDVLRGAADDRRELHFPVDAVASVRQHDRIAVADNHAVGRLEEHVRHTAVRPACRNGFRLRFRAAAAAFADVAEEVHGGVENLARVLNRREDPDLAHVVDVARPRRRGEPLVRRDVVGDFVEAELQPVFVLADQIQHGVGHRDPRIDGMLRSSCRFAASSSTIILSCSTMPDPLFAFDFERPELERLAARRRRAGLTRQLDAARRDSDRHEYAELPPSVVA